MSNIFGIQKLKLADGVTPEALETFWTKEFTMVPFDGWTPYLTKGIEGKRRDQFLIALVITPDAVYSASDDEEVQKAHREHIANHPQNPPMMEKLIKMTGFGTDYTDYEIIVHTELYSSDNENTPELFHYFPLELNSGVTPEQFETFCKETWSNTGWVDGLTCYVLKGIKGNRVSQYAFVVHAETPKGYDFEMLPKSERDAGWGEVFAANPQNRPAIDTLKTLVTGFADGEPLSTKYLDVGAPVYRKNR